MQMKNFPEILAQSDLLLRWTYSRQSIYELISFDEKFPQSVATVNSGRTRIWLLDDIRDYESSRPWLFEKKAKTRRYLHRKGGEDERKRREAIWAARRLRYAQNSPQSPTGGAGGQTGTSLTKTSPRASTPLLRPSLVVQEAFGLNLPPEKEPKTSEKPLLSRHLRRQAARKAKQNNKTNGP